MKKINHRKIKCNEVNIHVAESGEGPLLLMLHGAFELWYSWKDQITALADAGYHAAAPDLRGHGESDVTPGVRDYSLFQHARDMKLLIDSYKSEDVVLAGHDWGANLMWTMALLYPETIKAVIGLSIPFYPEPRGPEQMKNFFKDKFSFMRYFQKPGSAEAEFEHDPEKFFRLFLYGFSGDAPPGTVDNLFMNKSADAKLLEGFPDPCRLPSWLSEENIKYYADAYRKTGMTGTLNFYRNVDEDYPRLKETFRKRLTQSALFIGGGEEAAVKYGDLEKMKASLPGLRDMVILQRCGHYVQQERTSGVNSAIIKFLDKTGS